MLSLTGRIRDRLAQKEIGATQIISSVHSDLAARGFSEPGGLHISAIQERALVALETIFSESKLALVEHCALTATPASTFADEFVNLLENELNSLAGAIAAQVGGTHTPTGNTVSTRARSLIQKAKLEVGAA